MDLEKESCTARRLYLSAEGDTRKGLPKMTNKEIAQALLNGAHVDWCETLDGVLGLLENSLGKPVQVSRDFLSGWGSYSDSCGYVYRFEKSNLVLRAARISDWHGQALTLS
jgi:hypothetical protein